jgi:hypothetical protein
MHSLLASLLALLLTLAPLPGSAERAFRCAGDPLIARAESGPVDAVGIPNTAAGTAPGAFVLLRWRGRTLQLPRTNNAGPPSYTDGTWWWSLEDPEHPNFRLRQRLGTIEEFACEPEAAPPG